MDYRTAEPGDVPLTTGEDIGKITWPTVSADAGRFFGDFEGAGPHAYPRNIWDPAEFHGSFETNCDGLDLELRVTPAANGMAAVALSLRLPGAGQRGIGSRSLHLAARVRETWLREVARDERARSGQCRSIIDATLALAGVPGQRTVRILESGLSLREAATHLRA